MGQLAARGCAGFRVPTYSSERRLAGKQAGFVLIITLVIMVIIMLSSVALVMAVRAGISASANIAFRQTAVRSGDVAVDAAMTQINSLIGTGTSGTALNNDSIAGAAFRYYATENGFNSGCMKNAGATVFTPENYRFSDTSTGTDGVPCATRLGATPAGYALLYVVHRMAAVGGQCPGAGCTAPQVTATSAGDSKDADAPAFTASNNLTYYRVTVKVIAPRQNSYLQGFVY